MRWFNSFSITIVCIALLAACSLPPENTQQPAEPATQLTLVDTVQASPSIDMPNTKVSGTEVPSIEVTVRQTPPVVDISACEQATIIFTAQTRTEEATSTGSLYSICADGTDLREIMSGHEIAYGDLDISSDGQFLALSTSPRNSSSVLSTLSIVSLDSLLFSELITKEQARFGPQWSADGQYLGYLVYGSVPSETPPETYIQIMHLDSGTVSDIHLAGLNDFDWSFDHNRAVFGTWVALEEHSLDEYTVYIGEITCDNVTKKCQLSRVNEIPNVGQYPSWIPGTPMLVSVAMRFSDTGNRQILLLTNVQNGTVQEIDPGALDPKAASVSFPKGSVDGRYVGFIGPVGDLYVIDIDKMSIQNITSDNVENVFEVIRFEWLNSNGQ
jgi:Tol biopolymer transport system component